MAHRALAALALGVLLVGAATLHAAEPSRLVVEVSVCPSAALETSEVVRAVRAELDADGAVRTSDGGDARDGTLSANIECDAARSAWIRLQATGTGRSSERKIVLADAAASARPSLIALLAAELVRTDWAKLRRAEQSVVEYPEPDAATVAPLAPSPAKPSSPAAPAPNQSAPAPSAAPPRDRPERVASAGQKWDFSADFRLRWFVDYASIALGGDVGVERGPWRLRGEALFSSQQDALGSAAVGTAAGTVGYRLLEARVGPLLVATYPTLAAGVTWMHGTAANASVHVAPATGPYADLRVVTEARLAASRLSPTLAVELGRATGFVARADGRALGASGGFFIGANAGARY